MAQCVTHSRGEEKVEDGSKSVVERNQEREFLRRANHKKRREKRREEICASQPKKTGKKQTREREFVRGAYQ